MVSGAEQPAKNGSPYARSAVGSRAVAVTGELDRLAQQYQAVHGKPPSRRTLWLLHQQAGQNTRRTKAQARRTIAGHTGAAEPTAAQRLAAWEAQTARREVQALSGVHEQVTFFAASQRAVRARAALGDAAKRRAARIAVAEVQKQHAKGWCTSATGGRRRSQASRPVTSPVHAAMSPARVPATTASCPAAARTSASPWPRAPSAASTPSCPEPSRPRCGGTGPTGTRPPRPALPLPAARPSWPPRQKMWQR
jgi:hypothetical protein